MKFISHTLILLLLFFFGCATPRPSPDDVHVPPPEPSPYQKSVPPPPGKKIPATQRPYTIDGIEYTPIASADGFVQSGMASWYGKQFHGRKTSNGEIYDMYAMTAAHKTLPMNTWVSVENLRTGRKIVVRVNDRGPFVAGRIIDLSYTGASRIGIIGPGTGKVKVTALGMAISYSSKTHAPTAFKPMDYWKGNFTIQVGAFQVKENADQYRDKLSKTYPNTHITEFTDDRGTFYRVRIGQFTNLQDAIRHSEKMMEQGYGSVFAVAE